MRALVAASRVDHGIDRLRRFADVQREGAMFADFVAGIIADQAPQNFVAFLAAQVAEPERRVLPDLFGVFRIDEFFERHVCRRIGVQGDGGDGGFGHFAADFGVVGLNE